MVSLVLLVSSLVGVCQAVASEPWWHVATLSAPARPDGSEASVVLDIANLGDAPTYGTVDGNLIEAITGERKHLITVVDKLPAGVTPTNVHPEGGGNSLGWYGQRNDEQLLKIFGRESLCSISGQSVSCTYAVPVRPYEHIIIAIEVKVAQGAGTGENEVEVSGGEAAAVVSRHALAVEGPVPAYGVQTYEITPEEEGGLPATQAGSHPFQLTTTLLFNSQTGPVTVFGQGQVDEVKQEVQPVAMTKDLHFDLPPGLVGNPTPLPKCSLAEFALIYSGKGSCPNNTVVGVATPIVTNSDGVAWIPYATSEPLYSLEPSVGEPARFGFNTLIGTVILDTSVRTGGDYGVVVTVSNLTQEAGFMGSVVTFWGVPGASSHDNERNECLLDEKPWEEETRGPEPSCPTKEKTQPFLIMPTSCGAAPHTTVEADPWDRIGQFASEEYTFQNSQGEPTSTDGCNRLNFEPSITVAPDGQQASTPTGLTVGVHVPQEASLNASGLADSAVKNTTVTLPAGVGLNPAGADGLSACSEEQVGLESASAQTCPESSKVGTVEIKTPLLPNPLLGAAYLAQQDANPFGSLVALYILAYDPVSGVRIKVAGEVKPDPVTGQLVSTFDDTPQLPFEELSLHFFGGSRAPLGTPALCGPYTTTASIAPWSGNAPVESSSNSGSPAVPTGARARIRCRLIRR